jgi:hypothetical protein
MRLWTTAGRESNIKSKKHISHSTAGSGMTRKKATATRAATSVSEVTLVRLGKVLWLLNFELRQSALDSGAFYV